MSKLFFSTIDRLRPILARGELIECERQIESEMRRLPAGPFHIVLDLAISNPPESAASYFDRFFDLESSRYSIGAAYTEMNGFDINPGRWFCDVFAYDVDGGSDGSDWISDWQSKRFADYQICGLESLQKVYASDSFREKANTDASYMSSLMVVVKFQRFMQQAVPHMKRLRFPLYVTAHDFDFIAAFDPRPESERPRLRKLTDEEKVDKLIGRLGHEDSRERFRAAVGLSSLGAAACKAIPILIDRLSDTDQAVRQFAATALAKIDPKSDQVISALVERLKIDPLPAVRAEISRSLGDCPSPKSTAALAAAVSETDAGVRRSAVISLKLHGNAAKDAVPALIKLMETETDKSIRIQGSVALERMVAGSDPPAK